MKVNGNGFYINEIFQSISGEVGGFPQGANCLFIRLSGCNLKCDYCDAIETQSIHPDSNQSLISIVEQVKEAGEKNIVITGGEPFLQMTSLQHFVEILDKAGLNISIETNGTIPVPNDILKRATIVMDYKFNALDKMKDKTFIDLKPTDFIKFVIINDITMAMAMDIHRKLYRMGCAAQFAYSPMLSIPGSISSDALLLELKERAGIITQALNKSKLNGILNIQIHKMIGAR